MDIEAPGKNYPLLWKVYDHIKAHPEEWHQGAWASKTHNTCGTAFCFAGHAVMMAHPDAEPAWYAEHNSTDNVVMSDGECREIMTLAMDDLGLSDNDADVLFNGFNRMSDLHAAILGWEKDDQKAWLASH